MGLRSTALLRCNDLNFSLCRCRYFNYRIGRSVTLISDVG